jgi:leader peptidase (prepilin peptidase)/N-methyltransferase
VTILLQQAQGGVTGIKVPVLSYAAQALAFAIVVAVSVSIAPDLRGILGGLLGVAMLRIAVVDARSFIIPNVLVGVAVVLGLLYALTDEWNHWDALLSAALRGGCTFLAFYAVQAGFRYLRGREGLGFGDVKLAGTAGIWLQWFPLAVAIELAAVGALLWVGFRARSKRRSFRGILIPFGLFLAPAIWIGWLLQTLVPSP